MRGSEKKIIYIRDTGSRIFEEAYFVIRRGVCDGEGRPSENDMVREAERIVEESGGAYPAHARRTRLRGRLLSFFAGAAAAAALICGGTWLFALL
ncbi:MAG: hypothetical protein ACI3XP_01530 [Eubacteriales bacterium]